MIDYSLRGRFASQLATYNGFPQRVETALWSDGLLVAARQLEKSSKEEGRKFRATLIEKAQRAPSGEWRGAIEYGAEPFQIATSFLKPAELKLGTSSHLATALIETAPAIVSGNAKALARWFTLADVLTARGRRKVLAVMGPLSFGLPPQSALRLLKSGGVRLLMEGGFQSKATETVKNVYIPLTRLAEGRQWLRDRSQQVRQILDSAAPETRDEFKSIVWAAANASNANKRHWGEIMARELGIPL